jgi:hypothetical protein
MTAVEWLAGQLPLGVKGSILDKIEQAKEMEAKHIENAFDDGRICIIAIDIYLGDEYYNAKFKNK